MNLFKGIMICGQKQGPFSSHRDGPQNGTDKIFTDPNITQKNIMSQTLDRRSNLGLLTGWRSISSKARTVLNIALRLPSGRKAEGGFVTYED